MSDEGTTISASKGGETICGLRPGDAGYDPGTARTGTARTGTARTGRSGTW